MKYNVKKVKNFRQRGRRKNKMFHRKEIRFLGVNAAGIRSKLTSFEDTLNKLNPGVFFYRGNKDEG